MFRLKLLLRYLFLYTIKRQHGDHAKGCLSLHLDSELESHYNSVCDFWYGDVSHTSVYCELTRNCKLCVGSKSIITNMATM